MKYYRGVRALLTFLLVFAAILLNGSPAADAAAAVLPKPAQLEYIVDTAGMVSAEDSAQITKIGTELRDKTKAEIVVVTVPTLGGTDIETYANELVRSWGIGDAKLNNGVLLLIAKDDRAFRIEVGYGLEGAITDGYAGSVLDAMKSEFRKENYSPAILEAYITLVQKACTEYGVGLESLGAALGIPEKPPRLGYVVDLAEILVPEDAAQIEQMGDDLVNAAGVQAIIVTVPTVKKADAAQFAGQLFTDWKLADAAQGKSILLFIAKEERKALFVFGPSLSDKEKGDGQEYVINRIKSTFPHSREDLSEEIAKGYATLGENLCEASGAAVPDSIKEGSAEPFYVYIFGFLIAIPLIGLLLYCNVAILSLLWFAFASIVELVTLGKIKLLPSGSSGHTGNYGRDDDDNDRYTGSSGGGSSGGSSYGGGSSGGGGASGSW